MKLLAFVPIKLTLLLIVGILIGHYLPFDIRIALGITLTFLLLLGLQFAYQKNTLSIVFGIIAAATVISLGILLYLHAQPINSNLHYTKLASKNKVQWHLKIKEVLKPSSFSQRYITSITSINNEKASGKILLNTSLDTTSSGLQVDDEIWVYLEATDIKPPLNPHQFNYKTYLKQLGVYQQLNLYSINYVKNINSKKSIYGMAAKARNHILKNLKSAKFGAEELGVIQALLLGQRSDISSETYDNYKKAGAVHILAVSGLHIGILLFFIQFLLQPLRKLPKGKSIILAISVLLLWSFAFIAGLSPSIIRACTMFTFVAYAIYLNRPSNTFNILSLSLFFILLFINPNLLFQVGFQMSYAAVFAIVWIYPLLQKVWFPKNRIIRYIWQLLSVSAAAQLGVLPISLFYFHQFPGLFFISNLLIIPVLGFILGTGIVVIFLSFIIALPNWLVWIFNQLILWMNTVVNWVAQQEVFIFSAISFDGLQLVFSYLLIITLVLLLTKTTYRNVVFFLISLLGFQLWINYQDYATQRKKDVLVLHQTKNTIVLNRNGTNLTVLTQDSLATNSTVNDYKIGERITNISYDTLGQSYYALRKSLLIIDSLGIYPNEKKERTILLTNSPKINLERLIQTTNPKLILADGSNFKSYVNRWKKTCKKLKLPFHYTSEKGAYSFKSVKY